MAADRHKHDPISLRLREGDRVWLAEHAAATGRPVRAVLAEALAAYRRAAEPSRLEQLRAARRLGRAPN